MHQFKLLPPCCVYAGPVAHRPPAAGRCWCSCPPCSAVAKSSARRGSSTVGCATVAGCFCKLQHKAGHSTHQGV